MVRLSEVLGVIVGFAKSLRIPGPAYEPFSVSVRYVNGDGELVLVLCFLVVIRVP